MRNKPEILTDLSQPLQILFKKAHSCWFNLGLLGWARLGRKKYIFLFSSEMGFKLVFSFHRV
jgi:hypothetical protein